MDTDSIRAANAEVSSECTRWMCRLRSLVGRNKHEYCAIGDNPQWDNLCFMMGMYSTVSRGRESGGETLSSRDTNAVSGVLYYERSAFQWRRVYYVFSDSVLSLYSLRSRCDETNVPDPLTLQLEPDLMRLYFRPILSVRVTHAVDEHPFLAVNQGVINHARLLPVVPKGGIGGDSDSSRKDMSPTSRRRSASTETTKDKKSKKWNLFRLFRWGKKSRTKEHEGNGNLLQSSGAGVELKGDDEQGWFVGDPFREAECTFEANAPCELSDLVQLTKEVPSKNSKVSCAARHLQDVAPGLLLQYWTALGLCHTSDEKMRLDLLSDQWTSHSPQLDYENRQAEAFRLLSTHLGCLRVETYQRMVWATRVHAWFRNWCLRTFRHTDIGKDTDACPLCRRLSGNGCLLSRFPQLDQPSTIGEAATRRFGFFSMCNQDQVLQEWAEGGELIGRFVRFLTCVMRHNLSTFTSNPHVLSDESCWWWNMDGKFPDDLSERKELELTWDGECDAALQKSTSTENNPLWRRNRMMSKDFPGDLVSMPVSPFSTLRVFTTNGSLVFRFPSALVKYRLLNRIQTDVLCIQPSWLIQARGHAFHCRLRADIMEEYIRKTRYMQSLYHLVSVGNVTGEDLPITSLYKDKNGVMNLIQAHFKLPKCWKGLTSIRYGDLSDHVGSLPEPPQRAVSLRAQEDKLSSQGSFEESKVLLYRVVHSGPLLRRLFCHFGRFTGDCGPRWMGGGGRAFYCVLYRGCMFAYKDSRSTTPLYLLPLSSSTQIFVHLSALRSGIFAFSLVTPSQYWVCVCKHGVSLVDWIRELSAIIRSKQAVEEDEKVSSTDGGLDGNTEERRSLTCPCGRRQQPKTGNRLLPWCSKPSLPVLCRWRQDNVFARWQYAIDFLPFQLVAVKHVMWCGEQALGFAAKRHNMTEEQKKPSFNDRWNRFAPDWVRKLIVARDKADLGLMFRTLHDALSPQKVPYRSVSERQNNPGLRSIVGAVWKGNDCELPWFTDIHPSFGSAGGVATPCVWGHRSSRAGLRKSSGKGLFFDGKRTDTETKHSGGRNIGNNTENRDVSKWAQIGKTKSENGYSGIPSSTVGDSQGSSGGVVEHGTHVVNNRIEEATERRTSLYQESLSCELSYIGAKGRETDLGRVFAPIKFVTPLGKYDYGAHADLVSEMCNFVGNCLNENVANGVVVCSICARVVTADRSQPSSVNSTGQRSFSRCLCGNGRLVTRPVCSLPSLTYYSYSLLDILRCYRFGQKHDPYLLHLGREGGYGPGSLLERVLHFWLGFRPTAFRFLQFHVVNSLLCPKDPTNLSAVTEALQSLTPNDCVELTRGFWTAAGIGSGPSSSEQFTSTNSRDDNVGREWNAAVHSWMFAILWSIDLLCVRIVQRIFEFKLREFDNYVPPPQVNGDRSAVNLRSTASSMFVAFASPKKDEKTELPSEAKIADVSGCHKWTPSQWGAFLRVSHSLASPADLGVELHELWQQLRYVVNLCAFVTGRLLSPLLHGNVCPPVQRELSQVVSMVGDGASSDDDGQGTQHVVESKPMPIVTPSTSAVLYMRSVYETLAPRRYVVGPDVDVLRIGRDKSNDLVLVDSRISRSHARLQFRSMQRSETKEDNENSKKTSFTVEYVDLGSSGGSRVNGKTVLRAFLQPNDVIQIGHSNIIFVLESEKD